jgi:hypothetical protein
VHDASLAATGPCGNAAAWRLMVRLAEPAGAGMMQAVTVEQPRGDAATRGERLAGVIYGTIVVLSVVVAGARAYPSSPGHVAALATVTAVVFWLAHVYSFSLAHSVAHSEHLSFASVRRIAWREAPLVGAAVPPVAVLVLGALGVFEATTAYWVALGVGLAVLAAQGILFARIERLGALATTAVVAVNVGLGVLLIALKILVGHI